MKSFWIMICLSTTVAGPAAASGLSDPTAADFSTIQRCVDKAVLDGTPAEACIDLVSKPCMEEPGGFSTHGMNSCAVREHAIWDRMLNNEYGKLEAGASEVVFKALREVQRAWIAYRDIKCRFPYKAVEGTISGNFGTGCMNTTTARRAIELRHWREYWQK